MFGWSGCRRRRRLSRGQTVDIEFFPGLDRSRWWWHHPRGERCWGVATVIGVGGGHDYLDGMARPSHARCKAVPRLARSTGDGPVCSPLFGRLFGAVEENLISVDPVRCLMSFSPLPPGVMKHVRRQPNFSPPLDRFGGRKLGRVHVSGNPCDPHVQQSYGNRRRGLRLSSSSISSCKRLPSSFRGFG